MIKLFIIFNGILVLCAAKYSNISLINFDTSCKLKNGETGNYAVLHLCPELLTDLKLGGKFPKICESNEICWDVVCCPDEPEYGSSFEVRSRLKDGTCVLQDSGIEGIYSHKKYCPSLIDEKVSQDPVCPFEFCENMVCCPHNTTEVLEKAATIDYFKETCMFDETFDYSVPYEVGSGCVISLTADGAKNWGYCRPYYQCEGLENSYDFKNDKFTENVTQCGYNCCVPLVCCHYSYGKYTDLPITLANTACDNLKPVSRSYELSYPEHIDTKRSPNCKDNSTIVQSKKNLDLKEIGHMYSVVLGYLSSSSRDLKWDCEGVMISENTVLTTATCLDFNIKGPVASIRLGEDTYDVQKVIKHPHYKPTLIYHDIGLVKTRNEFQLPPNYYIACLPETRKVLNEELLIAGNADSSNKTIIKIVGNRYCKATTNTLKKGQLKYGILEDIQFCADLVDASTGDCPLKMVGSPLITKRGVVVGLNEVERKCEKDQPACFFESIYPYVRWIETFLFDD